MTQLRELDVVRVARLDHGNREFDGTEGCKREPRIGDTGTIVHDYAPGDANARVAVEMVNDSGLTSGSRTSPSPSWSSSTPTGLRRERDAGREECDIDCCAVSAG